MVEVAQATQNREQARLATVTADGAEQDAYLALITAMGISPLAQPRIAALPDHALSPALAQPVEQIITDAGARPDVLAAYAAEQAEQAGRARRTRTSCPRSSCPRRPAHLGRSSITAVPAIGQQAGTVNLDGSRSGSSVFLGVTLPLYDGGLARRRGCRRATTPPAPANA